MRGQLLPLSYLWLSLIFSFFNLQSSSAQKRATVLDEQGEALIGVHISYDDINRISDINGQFEWPSDLSSELVFKFDYLGYQDLEITVQEIIDAEYRIILHPDSELLEEIIIIGRTKTQEKDIINSVHRIEAKNIYGSASQNSADAIESSAAAYVQRSQMGGGSPVVRGFEANKLLLVVDGVRMNNAIYRNGHLQNAISVDASILDELDLIFGAGSLLYGSDALGGVIHFKTKTPELNLSLVKENNQILNSYVRFNSSNNEKRFHLDYNFGKKNWAVLTSISVVDFDDLRTGNNRSDKYPDFGKREDYILTDANGLDAIVQNENVNIQRGTAYSQIDLLQKWLIQHSDKLSSEFNFQFSNTSDVPRYDNLLERRNGILRYAEWNYGPQKRGLASHSLRYEHRNLLFDDLLIISSYQDINEKRISRLFNSNIREIQTENVKLAGITADLTRSLAKDHKVFYGLDAHYNKVDSNAESIQDPYSEDPVSQNNILSRYPDNGNSLFNFGAYVQHKWQSKKRNIIILNGLRYSFQKVSLNYKREGPFEWPEYYYRGLVSKNNAFVASSGVKIRTGNWQFNASTGSSFRAPNVDDLAKIRVNNDEITIPNPELRPEKVWSSELSISYSHRSWTLSVNAYQNNLSDAIIRQQAQLPDGSAYYINQGDSLLVTANTNASSAIIKGISLQADWRVNQYWTLKSVLNFQQAESKDQNSVEQALAHIPPSFGKFSLDFQKDRLSMQLSGRYNGWKRIEDFGGSVDNPELATEDGSPSFLILDYTMGLRIDNSWSVNMGLHNITDKHYRPFSSAVSGAGRHIFCSLKYHWHN